MTNEEEADEIVKRLATPPLRGWDLLKQDILVGLDLESKKSLGQILENQKEYLTITEDKDV